MSLVSVKTKSGSYYYYSVTNGKKKRISKLEYEKMEKSSGKVSKPKIQKSAGKVSKPEKIQKSTTYYESQESYGNPFYENKLSFQLKEILVERGLSTKGKNSDLIKRLRESDSVITITLLYGPIKKLKIYVLKHGKGSDITVALENQYDFFENETFEYYMGNKKVAETKTLESQGIVDGSSLIFKVKKSEAPKKNFPKRGIYKIV
jgi:hypothetical protein